eukprot:m.177186 g.177186  ORF g.177186 m.177186 type:complete len:465 (-) comp31874_c0_seq6:226-1620(-)
MSGTFTFALVPNDVSVATTGSIMLIPNEPVIIGRNKTTGIKAMDVSRKLIQITLSDSQRVAMTRLKGNCDQANEITITANHVIQVSDSIHYTLVQRLKTPPPKSKRKQTSTTSWGWSPSPEPDTASTRNSVGARGVEVVSPPSGKRRKVDGRTIAVGSLVGIGTLPLFVAYPSQPPSKKDVIGWIHKAIDLGVNFIDTADCYSPRYSDVNHGETVIQEALDTYTGAVDLDTVMVATKIGMQRINNESNGWRFARMDAASVKKKVQNSYKALGSKPIPLLQLHHISVDGDWIPKYKETLRALKDSVTEGLITRVGLCNATLEQINIAVSMLPIFSIQNKFSIWNKAPSTKPKGEVSKRSKTGEQGTLAYCIENSLHFLPHGALGGLNQRREACKIPEELQITAKKHGCSVQHVLLAFYRKRWPCIGHITGFRTLEHMTDSVRASTHPPQLSDAEVQKIFTACKFK